MLPPPLKRIAFRCAGMVATGIGIISTTVAATELYTGAIPTYLTYLVQLVRSSMLSTAEPRVSGELRVSWCHKYKCGAWNTITGNIAILSKRQRWDVVAERAKS